MIFKNYQSDFEFYQELGNAQPAPFELTYYIPGKEQKLIASYDGETYTNCRPDGKGIIVSVDYSQIQLGIGKIRCTARYYLNNEHYKDGIYEPVSDFEIGIELHRGESDDMGYLVATPLPLYTKGDPLTYADLTEEEKDDLASRVEVPTKTSELTNDSGFVTEGRVEEMIEDAVIESGGVVVDKEIDADSSNPVTNEAIARALEAAVARGRELAKRDLYIAAGAEYNDTDEVIKKTAFWGAEVDHLPHHYYLNGLGDITEEEMEYIYQRKDDMTTFIASGATQGGRFWQNISNKRLRTLFGTNNSGRWATDKTVSSNAVFGSCNIEVIKWTNTDVLANNDGPNFAMKASSGLFFLNNKLKVVDKFMLVADSDFQRAPNLEELRLWATNFNVTLSGNKKISKESIVFIITNVLKSTTKALVITLHADTYAKCIEGGEWHEEVQSALDTANAAITGGGSINLASA